MINQVPTSAGETGMEISIQSGDELEQLRCPEVFKRQLAEARAEWQRRHP